VKDIWDKLQFIDHIDMQTTCDVKNLSLMDGAVKDSKGIEDDES